MSLSPEQDAALQDFRQGHSLFITGEAGTGKSFLVRTICQQPDNMMIAATTGMAAIQLPNGRTLHALLGLPLEYPTYAEWTRICAEKLSKYPRNNIVKMVQRYDALLLDEVSMASAYMMNLVDILLRVFRKCHKTPFGGMQMVFIGDFQQLTPVCPPGSPPDQAKLAFQAPVWQLLNPKIHALKTRFRQAGDPTFQDMLLSVRRNIPVPELKQLEATPEEGDLVLFYTKKQVRQYNSTFFQQLPGDPVRFPFPLYSSGKRVFRRELENQVRDSLQLQKTDDHQEFKIGARVMLVRNLSEQKLVNGDRGLIVDFENGYPVVSFERPHQKDFVAQRVRISPIAYDRKRRALPGENNDNGYVTLASVEAIPLILGWAISIHRCQGITVTNQNVSIDGYMLDRVDNAFYVALSRAVSLSQVKLQNFRGFKTTPAPNLVGHPASMLPIDDYLTACSPRDVYAFFQQEVQPSIDKFIQQFERVVGEKTGLPVAIRCLDHYVVEYHKKRRLH